ncbi:DNA-directed RNA polymerase subunit delta [Paenibacillus turicensis]|uniref:Probable DNA-directed RNA polymerase subunit delta n=1 Tax=Paenibacillus turicensis TaxID=160487 RepID=A0ABS4FYD7_9BACL|nr:DNA-directed RNA polymerase subunit delta [Paenibacillus turicensis]
MSTPLNLNIDQERALEIPMVDLAFMVLKAANTPYYYRDLMKEVAKLRGMSEEQSQEAIAELYTEINIDGRFACVGANLWGLKRWYPIERSEDPVSSSKRPRIINDDVEDDDFSDEVEKKFTADNDGFDSVDDEDELFTDEDEEIEDEDIEDVEDDSLIDDEEIDEDLVDDELSDDEEEQDEEDEDYEEEDYDK